MASSLVRKDAPKEPTTLSRRTQTRLGFRTKYEFTFWSIYALFMTVFFLIRSPYGHPPTFQKASQPGEWYWFHKNPYWLGMFLHLWTTLPAGFLSIFQFLPIIRSNYPTFHKVTGYAIFVLLTLGNIGVIMFSRISMGGNDMPLLAAIWLLVIATSVSMFLGWYNMRYQQVEQHRKWMLRAMSWMSIIVTQRLILLPSVIGISYIGGYYTLWSCPQILSVIGDTPTFHAEFPSCVHDPSGYAAVAADLKGQLHIASAVRWGFSGSTWIAISLHTFLTELYINLTPKENERLRLVSYHRQRAVGLSPAGSAGITADRWGDGFPWTPPSKKILEETGPSDVNGVPRQSM